MILIKHLRRDYASSLAAFHNSPFEVQISRHDKMSPCLSQIQSPRPGPPLGSLRVLWLGNGTGGCRTHARSSCPKQCWCSSGGRRGSDSRNPRPILGLARLTRPWRSMWGRRPKLLSPHALHRQINVPFVFIGHGSQCQHCIYKLDK